MVGIDRLAFSHRTMARIGEAISLVGLGNFPAGRGQDELPSEKGFGGNPLTSDFNRYMRTVRVWDERPDLIVAKPTFRWGATAMRAMANAQADAFPLAIKAPV